MGSGLEAVGFEAEIVVGHLQLAVLLALEKEALIPDLLGLLAHTAGPQFFRFVSLFGQGSVVQWSGSLLVVHES